mgnify:CR=1 FL=1
MSRVAIIGGGPAGMMCASEAAHNGHSVTLYERNEKLGKKLFITGKGRCNLTNSADIKDFFENIPRNPRFLYSALYGFTNDDLVAAINAEGVPTKVERGGRIFPQSDKSSDILRAMANRVKKAGVDIRLNSRVKAIIKDEAGFIIDLGGKKERYDAVVLATGGASYTSTGSTGDGYRIAAALGHTIVEPRGSLVPLVSDDDCCRHMQGLSLKNVELTVYNGKNKTVFREFGEMLFTHFGVSGPLVLSASAHLRDWGKEQYRLSIDLKPALDQQKLEARILRDISESPNRDVEKLLCGLVPHSMAPVMTRRLGLPPTLKANSLTKEQRRGLIELLKHFAISVTGVRPVAEAIVTAGGVKVSEVKPNTMESKLVEGLYFAGEILDVDAYTGGFNLQIAWATGHLAGVSAAERE